MHAVPSAPVYPTLHLHADPTKLSALEWELLGQAKHKELSLALYVSLGQDLQVAMVVAAVKLEY